ncbi:hypothetical protein [Streptomyces sp. NBC_01602]|uniref:hypothetical protein n=1 Tax=Streptomyces sp. NBC_01602 TaxID=2975893 RepID=UPI00386D1276|nr:hypothetical protein OG955_02215 [Streptomyces sp. NBC_01602]
MSTPDEPAGTVVEAVKLEAPLLPLTADPDILEREARLLQAEAPNASSSLCRRHLNM